MNKEEYYKKSDQSELPKRCPILNLCVRRAYTIYFYSDHSLNDTENNVIKKLQDSGELSKDFLKDKVDFQGESPLWKKSIFHVSYRNMCPEVNLFDKENSLPFAEGIASSDGEWDDLRKGKKFENQNNKHFSECAEFCSWIVQQKHFSILKSKKRTSHRANVGISSKLRFEIFQRDKFTCQYCKRTQQDDGVKLELDHKIAISKGGTDDYDNLITSCKDCNQGKSNKSL